MASFPNLKSGSPALHPASLGRVTATRLTKFEDGSEQRWAAAENRFRWVLTYRGLDGYDLSILRAFFTSMKGRFDSTWDITVSGVLYENMAFESDSFRVTETQDGLHDVTLAAVQEKP